MIYITCGTCGTSKGYKTRADGAISLPADEEKRLVSRGVAAYVTKPVLPDDAPPAPEIVNGHYTVDSLVALGRKELDAMAAELGIDTKKCKKKEDVAVLLAEVDLEDDEGDEDGTNGGNGTDDDAPPAPAAGDPV